MVARPFRACLGKTARIEPFGQGALMCTTMWEGERGSRVATRANTSRVSEGILNLM